MQSDSSTIAKQKRRQKYTFFLNRRNIVGYNIVSRLGDMNQGGGEREREKERERGGARDRGRGRVTG
jgi:hypothetical protein